MGALYISIYTDEDVYGSVVRALRDRGYDAISTPEAGNLEQADADQLSYAVSQKRAILTFNFNSVSADEMQNRLEYLTDWTPEL